MENPKDFAKPHKPALYDNNDNNIRQLVMSCVVLCPSHLILSAFLTFCCIPTQGNAHVVFNGSFYYNERNSPRIIKYDLNLERQTGKWI